MSRAVVFLTFGIYIFHFPFERLEHAQICVTIHSEPVLRVVNVNQVPDELIVILANDSSLSFVGPKHVMVVQGVVDNWVT